MDLGRFELCLNVADISASRHFYEKLGFEVTSGEEDEGWLQLQNSAVTIALYQGHIGSNLLNFRGLDVVKTADELVARGVALTKPLMWRKTEARGLGSSDPDGNVIYLNTMPGEEIV